MNALERFVYGLVKDRPVLKQRIVDVYQAVLGLVPQRAMISAYPVRNRPGYFFGFHDKTPFSQDGERLLAHRNLVGNRLVRAGDEAEVGYFEGPTWMEFVPLARTTGWNWQLGSMLQWCGTRSQYVAHNDVRAGRPVGMIRGADGAVLVELERPVAHLNRDGSLACSYDFGRVETAMPGYGMVMPAGGSTTGDGAFRVFETSGGGIRFEMSLAEAAAIEPHESMVGAFHFFHHALFNPGGTRLFFLHRWLDRNARRWTRMFSVGENGGGLYLFPMNEMVSHITWISDTEVFAYARYPGEGDGYFRIADRTGHATRYFADILDSDGHPTFDGERGLILTDSYPDRFRNQRLLLGSPAGDSAVRLCRTHLPRKFRGPLQVDLHPRLHPLRYVACFDSGHSGTRSLATLDFSSAIA